MLSGKFEKFYKAEAKKEYFENLIKFVEMEDKEKKVYPEKQNRFKALEKTPFENVKVVILGQDPYHGKGQAQGFSFSVPNEQKIPPSLRNIYKELESDLNIKLDFEKKDLTKWTEQGVLLLNSVLTVEESNPASHSKKGWEIFTDNIINLIATEKKNVVFILWGKHSEKKEELIKGDHKIIKSAHPSPFSARRGFFGSKCFSKTNDYLIKKNITEIDWSKF
jgi:uracil-DNA glycosylase